MSTYPWPYSDNSFTRMTPSALRWWLCSFLLAGYRLLGRRRWCLIRCPCSLLLRSLYEAPDTSASKLILHSSSVGHAVNGSLDSSVNRHYVSTTRLLLVVILKILVVGNCLGSEMGAPGLCTMGSTGGALALNRENMASIVT